MLYTAVAGGGEQHAGRECGAASPGDHLSAYFGYRVRAHDPQGGQHEKCPSLVASVAPWMHRPMVELVNELMDVLMDTLMIGL